MNAVSTIMITGPVVSQLICSKWKCFMKPRIWTLCFKRKWAGSGSYLLGRFNISEILQKFIQIKFITDTTIRKKRLQIQMINMIRSDKIWASRYVVTDAFRWDIRTRSSNPLHPFLSFFRFIFRIWFVIIFFIFFSSPPSDLSAIIFSATLCSVHLAYLWSIVSFSSTLLCLFFSFCLSFYCPFFSFLIQKGLLLSCVFPHPWRNFDCRPNRVLRWQVCCSGCSACRWDCWQHSQDAVGRALSLPSQGGVNEPGVDCGSDILAVWYTELLCKGPDWVDA